MIQRDLSCSGVGPAHPCAPLRSLGAPSIKDASGVQAPPLSGRKERDLRRKPKGKLAREMSRERAAAANERTLMPRRRGMRSARGGSALRGRGNGASASPSSVERMGIQPALCNLANAGAIVDASPSTRAFGEPDKVVVSAGFENVRLEEDVADAIAVEVVAAPLVLCGALEGDAAHELILVA